MQIDAIDRHIISCLVQDARRSFREVGLAVGLSAPAVKRRVDRLRADGVITGFAAQVDPARIGWTMRAFVEVTFSGNISPAEIQRMLNPISEVVAAYTVSGAADVLLQVRAADMAQFEQALERIRSAKGVGRTESTIVMSNLIDRPATTAATDSG